MVAESISSDRFATESMYLLRMRRQYGHKGRRKWSRAPETTASFRKTGVKNSNNMTSSLKPEVVIGSKLHNAL